QPWTLAIKAFNGMCYVESASRPTNFLDKLLGRSEQLNASAMNAHNMAEAMRKMGFEAYVLHTRSSSIVTVGGFASQDDPRMNSVKESLRPLQFQVDKAKPQSAGSVPAGSTNLQLFPQPLPMEVPRL